MFMIVSMNWQVHADLLFYPEYVLFRGLQRPVPEVLNIRVYHRGGQPVLDR